ncbi:hypothetical protein WJX77_005438 [Trebouxia sp. C0004]
MTSYVVASPSALVEPAVLHHGRREAPLVQFLTSRRVALAKCRQAGKRDEMTQHMRASGVLLTAELQVAAC